MSKLNKSQINKLVAATVANTINANTGLFKKDKAHDMIVILTAALSVHLAPMNGGGASTKIDADGNVFCNYFKSYFTAKHFNTKLGKPNKETGERLEGYKANSILGEQILRKLKILKRNVEMQATENLRSKTIAIEEFDTMLGSLDAALAISYEKVEDVPTVADVVGLTEELAK